MIAEDQREAARTNLGPLARVARVSQPISRKRLRPMSCRLSALAERGKQSISIDRSGKSDRQESTKLGRARSLPAWSAEGHEDAFPRPGLSARFSIAADVKARPDRLVLRVGLPVTRGSRFSSRSAPGRLMMG